MMNFITKEPINKGWSCDKKYCVTTADGTKYLLRITPFDKSASRENMFLMQQKVAELGIPMCKSLEIGECNEGIYILQTWIDGKDANEVIPYLADSEQYALGLEAGKILKKIHSIPAPKNQQDWENRINDKADLRIRKYNECPLKYDNGQAFIDFINANRYLLKGRPQVFQHGDYHIGNMMIENGKIVIIDFDRYDFGDPWEEFKSITWCAQASPLFASGMVNGYFDNDVPMEFWKLLALYISLGTITSLPWAIPYGEGEVQTMRNLANEVLEWYDNMQNPVPSWYFKGYYLQDIDGLPYKMKAPFDFSFISRYGKVFKVFDDQDSGNICFGTEKDGERYFVKFAGAPTEAYNGSPEDAIERLKSTQPVYENLKHKNLIEFVEAKEINGGFAMAFKWVDGDCMGRMYPAEHRRFMCLPVADRLNVFGDILDFLDYTNSRGYVAVDFYDGSIMYDADNRKTTICDIDFFRKQPCINDMGRMWGSSKFQSPEEYQLGGDIDEVTNVYTAGAMAFALFGNYNRTRDEWQLSDEAFAVATKAVSDNRNERYQSIKELKDVWEKTL